MYQNQSVPNKVLQWSFILPRAGKKYISADMMSATNAAVLFSLGYELNETFFPEYSRRDLERYLKLRGLPKKVGNDIIKRKSTCFANSELDAEVRALTRDRWKKHEHDLVKINDLALQTDTPQRKIVSFENMDIKCPCRIAHWEEMCRVSRYHRDMFGDGRNVKSIPSPTPTVIICEHAFIAANYSTLIYGTYDYGIFGPSIHLADIANDAVNYVLAHEYSRRKKPDYVINRELRDLQSEMFKPISDLVWHRIVH